MEFFKTSGFNLKRLNNFQNALLTPSSNLNNYLNFKTSSQNSKFYTLPSLVSYFVQRVRDKAVKRKKRKWKELIKFASKKKSLKTINFRGWPVKFFFASFPSTTLNHMRYSRNDKTAIF